MQRAGVFMSTKSFCECFNHFVKQLGSLLSNLSSILKKKALGSLVAHLI